MFIQGAAATPRHLVPALAEHGRSKGLKGVKVQHIHTEGEVCFDDAAGHATLCASHLTLPISRCLGAAEYNAPDLKDTFRSNSLFTGANCRQAINEGN